MLKNTQDKSPKYVCHYTTIDAVKGIFNEKLWYLGSPRKMNDGLELSSFDDRRWNNVFFCSLLNDVCESIAMWSMYAQPWEKGVMIKIPMSTLKEWITGNPEIYEADDGVKNLSRDKRLSNEKLFIHAVAYSTSQIDGDSDEVLKCGGESNHLIKESWKNPNLIGYVKNAAWEYEKEIRLRVDVDDADICHKGVAIDIPDTIISSFEVVAGPRFETRSDYSNIITSISLFSGKLNRIYCDTCTGEMIERYKPLWSSRAADFSVRQNDGSDEIVHISSGEKYIIGDSRVEKAVVEKMRK